MSTSEFMNGRTVAYNMPYVVEQTPKGERAYDVYSRLLADRIVFITGEITDDMANAVCAQLLLLQSQSPDSPVYIYVNTPGGVVTAGLAILDVMNYISCPVYTYCIGQAASMGAVLLSAGEKGHRYSLPNARVMIHQPSGGMEGKASDVEISYREMKKLKDVLNRIIAVNTGKKLGAIESATDRDNFMSADEAVKFGLIDKVIKKAVRLS